MFLSYIYLINESTGRRKGGASSQRNEWTLMDSKHSNILIMPLGPWKNEHMNYRVIHIRVKT